MPDSILACFPPIPLPISIAPQERSFIIIVSRAETISHTEEAANK